MEQRIENINEYFTFSLYSNVCRSLFEKHKLMFAFLLCTRIMMNENKINMVNIGRVHVVKEFQTGLLRRVRFLRQAEWRYLLSGGMPAEILDNPADDWLSDRAWQDILGLSALDKFSTLAKTFSRNKKGFKNIFDSLQPHRCARQCLTS